MSASPTFAERVLAHSRERKLQATENVVNITSRSAESASPPASGPISDSSNFSSAIELIHEASEAIRISEQRASDLELQMKELLTDAAAEINRLKSEIAEKETLIARAEGQAQAAEARAHEAEAWLGQLNEAVMSSLAPLQRRRLA